MIITGQADEEHINNLITLTVLPVLQRLEQYGVIENLKNVILKKEIQLHTVVIALLRMYFTNQMTKLKQYYKLIHKKLNRSPCKSIV